MKLIKKGDKFVAVSTYAEKDIPKGAGFRWDPANRFWWTSDLAKANSLAQFADDNVRAELEAAKRERKASIEASRAKDAGIQIPAPDGLAYLPFQKAGVAYAIEHQTTLMADEMGLGKTIQAIGVINSLPEIRSVLVICPASLKINWKRELDKWLIRQLCVEIANIGSFPSSDIVVINYDILAKHASAIHARKWDLLVIDEAHYCFPENTKVSTSEGEISISQIVNNRIDVLVKSYNLSNSAIEWKRITHFHKHPQYGELVKIVHEKGELICTKDHQLWTGAQYEEASKSCGKNLQILQETFSPNTYRVFNTDCSHKITDPKSSVMPQDRSCNPRTKVSNRNRRAIAFSCPNGEIGSKEDGSLKSSRVVRVEVLKRGGSEQSEISGGENYVYCLSIQDNENFFADGVLVSNCKNPKAQRTQNILGKWDRDPAKAIPAIQAKRKLFLSGTFITNGRPIELWPVIRSIQADGLKMSWEQYVTRYCNARRNRYGWDVSGASNLEELQEKLRASVMVRRLKKDVLTELPPKRRQVIELPVNGVTSVILEQKAWAAQEGNLLRLKAAVELAKASEDEGEYEAAVKALRGGTGAAFTEMSVLRHKTALAKVPMVIEHIQEALEASGKVVLFCHHKDVAAKVAAEFDGTCVTVTGDDKIAERQACVDKFQADPKVQLFVGTIGAAGLGITLTASAHVVFAELDWVPGNVTQAEDRLHRIGQAGSILVQHLVLEGSLDATMAKTLIAKQDNIDRALDREFAEQEKSEPVLPIATSDLPSRKTVEREAKDMSEKQISAIHKALGLLAGRCDGARKKDEMGFDRLDTLIGRNLAYADKLTAKQAALGRRILLKYHKQLPEEVATACKNPTI
jgi:hypothetical protein